MKQQPSGEKYVRKARVAYRPACSTGTASGRGGYGICFERADMKGRPVIPAISSYVTCTQRNTTLALHGVEVATTEHLMAALYGMGIDNVHIRVHGPEVPAMDGSALFFAQMVQKAGIRKQAAARDYYALKQPLEYENKKTGTVFTLTPATEFSLLAVIDFSPKTIGRQIFCFNESIDFMQELASARTFVFLDEIIPLLKKGMIRGGDLDNALVLADGNISAEDRKWLGTVYNYPVEQRITGYVNKEGLRYPNECVRHKTVDLLGDLYLVGRRLKAAVRAYKPGHKANVEVAQMIRTQMEKYAIK